MGLVATFDPSAGNLSVNGLPIGGFADGTFLVIAREGPLYTIQRGADGEISRSKNVADDATARVSLHQTSQANKIFSTMAQLDRLTGKGIGAFLWTEGDNVVASIECWVEELPSIEYAKEAGPREWILRLAKAEIVLGGNRR